LLPGDFIFIGLFFAIIYFLMIRPQAQERQRHEELVTSLSKDMAVVTRSGIHGRVIEVGNDTVVLEVAKGTRVTFDKLAVFRREGETVDMDAIGPAAAGGV